ncbi:DUF4244 domain-containing protein [Streptomyces cavernicola]|uniref:DUF4244 domain-containing protein n=1 Tax=Streptomyces cavernicola TaxID=3043613 RepID=A0ABT6SMS9_9ACTN|nr:DUF4244 domain-containing protein [Streptomyces sp. B-S-A6]MDI3409409.1 DUF4244 domain-containing protein [Streptomyces sp. B-S-A6]
MRYVGKLRNGFGADGLGGRCRGALRLLRARLRAAGDAGMTTSEYAMGTVAACGFAAVLYKVVTSDAVQAALESIVAKALGVQA